MPDLGPWGNIATIVSVIAAGIAFVVRWSVLHSAMLKRRACLEGKLAGKQARNDDKLTLGQLGAATGYTDNQIIEALHGSKVVKPVPGYYGNDRSYKYVGAAQN